MTERKVVKLERRPNTLAVSLDRARAGLGRPSQYTADGYVDMVHADLTRGAIDKQGTIKLYVETNPNGSVPARTYRNLTQLMHTIMKHNNMPLRVIYDKRNLSLERDDVEMSLMISESELGLSRTPRYR